MISGILIGGLGVVWCIAWLFLVSDTPATHRRITIREKKYIENSLIGQIETGKKKVCIYRDIV